MSQSVIFVFDENEFREHCVNCGLSNEQIAQLQTMLFPSDIPMANQILRVIEKKKKNNKPCIQNPRRVP